jgi:hypothetical protein
LLLTPGNQDSQTLEYVCKPWVKQRWWAIYWVLSIPTSWQSRQSMEINTYKDQY